MQRTVLRPDAIVVDGRTVPGAEVLVEDGRIALVEAGLAERFPTAELRRIGGTLLPGFVDLQVNGMGGRGCDEPDFEALDTVARTAWRGGAAAFLPTLITAPFDELCRRAAFVADWIERGAPDDGAVPLGIHLEGPFLERAGAHDARWFVDPTEERIAALLAAARGHLRLVTLAPARAGAEEAVRRLTAAGVTVALGHADRTDSFADCVAAGARLVTHLFNAMSPLHHRAPGIVGHALDDARLSCSLVLDGHHVHAIAARVACRVLGIERTVLVTDAMAAAGMPDGRYTLSGVPVELRDGVVRDTEGRLAGSAATMADVAAFYLQHVDGADAAALARTAATNPAALIGAERFGALRAGAVARCVALRDGRCTPIAP